MPLFDSITGLDDIKKELKERVDYLASIINTLTPRLEELNQSIRELNRNIQELNRQLSKLR
jgi:prefoldin subunit 5